MDITPVEKMVPIPKDKKECISFVLRCIADFLEKAQLYDEENLIFEQDSGIRETYLGDDDYPHRDLDGTKRFRLDLSWYDEDWETHLCDNGPLREMKILPE